MKRLPSRYAFLAAALFVGVTAIGRSQPVELFFSEYIEGSSNNKALEIYNGTGTPINLATDGYNVQMHFNGNPAAGLTINLTGSVADGDVYVLAQAAATGAILAQADQTNGSGWFNGDDAVVLRKGTTVIDVIGQIGLDPGTEWGSGLTSTADNTLRRNLSVTAGDADGSNPFDPSIEWVGFATDTFGGLGCHNADLSCPAPPPVEKEVFEIQGNGLASPFVGTTVTTRDNVVTAVFSSGFFIQTPSARADANAETSNGIFVFTGGAPTVSVGDEVTVTGMVSEFFNMTELDAGEVTVTNAGFSLPAPVTFDESTPSPNQPQPATEMERFEGMLVRVVDGTVSSPTNQFGEASVVAAPQRAFREPGIAFPGLTGLPVWDANPEIFEIDTDLFAASPGLRLAGGATVTAEGPLAFSFGDYQIWPTSLEFTGQPEVVPVRGRAAGELTVGSQNFLRLFDTMDDPATDDPIPTLQQSADRLTKFSLHVRVALGAPDILAVQEVENLGVLQDVANKIRADDSALNYTPYLFEGNDIGGIDVGFLVRDTVRVDSIEQFGEEDLFTFGGTTALLNDRPPLVLRGAYVGNGAPFPLVVIDVHQRSLSGIDGSDGARVRAKRFEQALRLSQYIDGLQDAEPGIRLVVIGDFNSFEFTDGYVDVMGQVTGNPDPAGALLPATDEISLDLTNQTFNMPELERYSFVFDGTAQSLDHAITSQALDPWVRGAQHSRGNADAPFDFDVDPTTPLRSSDHDGTVLFIMSDSDADGVPDDGDSCAGSSPSATVVIDDCDSGAANDVFSDGCKITDRIAACAASSLTHDDFTACATQLTSQLKRDGFITNKEKADIQKCAAKADIP
jgi:predicted extracellular nuclease